MRIRILSGKRKNTPKYGDVKTCNDGVFERRQSRFNGMLVVSNNRPVFEWVRIGDAPPDFKGRAIIGYYQ